MANGYALSAVTAALRGLLAATLKAQKVDEFVAAYEVSALAPERLGEGNDPRLNLFLFRVTPNTGWTPERRPSRNAAGDRTQNPYLALDLYYLLSAYGTTDLEAEVMLGLGMQALHEVPVLTRDHLKSTLRAVALGGVLPAGLADKGLERLADQVEQLRVSPHLYDSEETSRLWSSLNAGLRPSATYKVTVVLIERRANTREAPPVLDRRLYVEPLRRPHVDRLLSNPTPANPNGFREGIVHPGHRLALLGRNLRGPATEVQIDDRVLVPPVITVGAGRIELDVPADLRVGIHAVQVAHRIPRDPATPALGRLPFELSNPVALVLSPSLAVPPATPVELLTPLGADPVDGTVRVRFGHSVGADQQVELLLNEVALVPAAGRAAFAYTFPATPAGAPTVTELDFEIRDVRQALYLVRVRVDRVSSDVGVAVGPGLDPKVKALADADRLSDPMLVLTP